jgi:probable selenium-dependent hydroxylase accessory protein YqeC
VITIFDNEKERLWRAFDLPRGVTALVGGGGKTTLMLRLAHELAQDGMRVVVTTTTHIFPPDGIVTLANASEMDVLNVLTRERVVCLGTPEGSGKLSSPNLPVGTLAKLADYVLIEADGAKQLPLKAPAEHEPVIPDLTKLVIAVAGLDGLGKLIREAVFRPERYAALIGKHVDDVVTAPDIARVLTHPSGQRKGVSDQMRFSVLLNQADDVEAKDAAIQIAAELGVRDVERTIVASLEKYKMKYHSYEETI